MENIREFNDLIEENLKGLFQEFVTDEDIAHFYKGVINEMLLSVQPPPSSGEIKSAEDILCGHVTISNEFGIESSLEAIIDAMHDYASQFTGGRGDYPTELEFARFMVDYEKEHGYPAALINAYHFLKPKTFRSTGNRVNNMETKYKKDEVVILSLGSATVIATVSEVIIHEHTKPTYTVFVEDETGGVYLQSMPEEIINRPEPLYKILDRIKEGRSTAEKLWLQRHIDQLKLLAEAQ